MSRRRRGAERSEVCRAGTGTRTIRLLGPVAEDVDWRWFGGRSAPGVAARVRLLSPRVWTDRALCPRRMCIRLNFWRRRAGTGTRASWMLSWRHSRSVPGDPPSVIVVSTEWVRMVLLPPPAHGRGMGGTTGWWTAVRMSQNGYGRDL